MCPCCRGAIEPLWTVRSFDYYRCLACGSLCVDPALVKAIDTGSSPPLQNDDVAHREAETAAARERAYGSSLARVAEAVLYARTPVRRFLDVGSGHGFLLDALSMHLPAHRDAFYGVERFPPPNRSAHPNYVAGGLTSLAGRFDAGSCIEVIGFLTPVQLRTLLAELATRSNPGALYIVNTGLPEYVVGEDRDYLDAARGRLFIYSLAGVARLAEPLGFRVLPLRGKTWAFLLEYARFDDTPPQDRIWSAPAENVALLRDPERGSVLHLLGLDTARAYPAG